MSDAGKPVREWRFYIDDMVGFAEKVLSYTEDMDQAAFMASEITYDAVLRNLELTGAAATRIPGEVREAHPEISWRMIVATRNRLIHAYLGIDDDIIWSIVRDDIPSLLSALKRLKHDLKAE
jgi:uncharacterized protein with HEPN domain